jgi:polysaccharide pyruvyl transferase WcaK-like protein
VSGRHRTVRFWGNFGTGNLGNECTLQAIIHSARQWWPDAELGCICPEPQDVLRRHGIRATPLYRPLRRSGRRPPRLLAALRKLARVPHEIGAFIGAVRTLSGTNRLIVAGTGVLSDTGEGVFGLPYQLLYWSLAARCARCPVYLVGVGVEAIADPVSRLFIAIALRAARYRSYRDRLSRDRLFRRGFAFAGSDPVCPDLAFSLPPEMVAIQEPAPRRRPTVAVGLYGYHHVEEEDGRPAYGRYLDKISSLIVRLVEAGYSVRIVIGDLGYDQEVRGDVRARLTATGLPATSVVDEAAQSVEQLLGQLAEADLVVATRFHNVLLSLMLGKPVVSLSYDAKNDALMAEMGLERFCQPIETFETPRVLELLEEARAERDRLREGILATAARFREELERQYRLVFGSAGS